MATESRKRAIFGSASLDFASIAAGASEELTVAVQDAAVGDVVALGPPSDLDAGLIAIGYVSDVEEVTVRLINTTAGAIDAAESVWNVSVQK